MNKEKTKADQFEKKVLTYCERNRMLEAGDRVVVGVSGGADSVCLLFLLCAFRERLPFSLRVVHVHHGIREEAQEDAAYVESLCERVGLPYLQVNVNVPQMAAQEGLSEEEAGRNARYKAFYDAAAAWQQEAYGDPRSLKIALAHHMGDRAETLLFHLFRGSGIRGLGSILPCRETEEGYRVIRPLLCAEREEIEEYLSGRGIAFCQDSTNLQDEYARNRIRHHILPYAEKEICQGAVRHLNEAAELLAEAEDYLELQTAAAFESCVKENSLVKPGQETVDEKRINVAAFLALHPLLQKRVLLRLLCALSPGQKDIGAVHVKAVSDLFQGESGRQRDLPFGITAQKEYGEVKLWRTSPGKAQESMTLPALEIPMDQLSEERAYCCRWGSGSFEFRILDREKNEIIPEKTYTKWFDYDKIKNTLFLRTRRTGDYLQIRGEGGRSVQKTLKDYFITEKLPRNLREELPLLAEGRHILWITGYRISEGYKVDRDTKRVLQVTFAVRD